MRLDRSMRRRVVTFMLLSGLMFGAGWQPARAVSPYERWLNGPSTAPDYFPIGVYLQNPTHARRYAAIGINLYVGLWKGPTSAQIATLKAANMRAVVSQNAIGLADTSGTIVGWMQEDEPDNAQPDGRGGFGPPKDSATVVADYRRLQRADPTRPILLILGRGLAWDGWYGRKERTNHPEDYPRYLEGADIASFDIYPGASPEAAVRNKFRLLPDGVDRLRAWAKPGSPIWVCVETGNIGGSGGATPEQVRAQTWGAIIRGATGIIYFVHQLKPVFNEHRLLDDPVMMEQIDKTNREITMLARVLNAPAMPAKASAIRRGGQGRPIDLMRRDLDGAVYLFAAELDGEPGNVTFRIEAGGATGVAEVIGEGRTITVRNGIFQDTVAPYSVRIYRHRADAP
jgi:hypothetical protein